MFQREKFLTVYPEAKQLMRAHHEEVDLFGFPLDIDWRTYSLLCEDERYIIFTYREEDNTLIGYAAFFLFLHTHHKTSLQAQQDVLFIKKDKRGKGLLFLKYCEEELRELEVQVVQHSVPASNDWSKLLTRTGYKVLETNYIKEL